MHWKELKCSSHNGRLQLRGLTFSKEVFRLCNTWSAKQTITGTNRPRNIDRWHLMNIRQSAQAQQHVIVNSTIASTWCEKIIASASLTLCFRRSNRCERTYYQHPFSLTRSGDKIHHVCLYNIKYFVMSHMWQLVIASCGQHSTIVYTSLLKMHKNETALQAQHNDTYCTFRQGIACSQFWIFIHGCTIQLICASWKLGQ